MSTARKYTKIAAGFLLLASGVVLSLPGVPGPGLLLIFAALVILAGHFQWANKMLQWIRRKVPFVPKRTDSARR